MNWHVAPVRRPSATSPPEVILRTILLLSPSILLLVVLLPLLFRFRTVRAELAALRERFRGVTDAEAERDRILADARNIHRQSADAHAEAESALTALRATMAHERDAGEQEIQRLGAGVERIRRDLALLDEEANLLSFGFYRPRYAFATSQAYQARLEAIRDR